MKENYQAFCERMVFRYEGNYGWDRADSGGPTKYGITCWDLAAHRHQKMHSMSAWAPIVAAMPLSEALDIYATKYATACHFDELPSGPDCVVFDTGVNSGPSRGIKIAQYVVGVAADGVIGPITLKAICDYSAVDFVNRHCDQRMAFLRRLGNWSVFRGGWTSRVSDLRRYSLGLATGKPKLAAGYAKKEPVILHAHVKAYAAEDIAVLKAEHGHEDNHEQR